MVVIPANFWKSRGFYARRHFIDCVFSRHFGLYVFFNDFQFLVTHVHKFHIFVAVFLISMSHVHVSHHIIYLYKVVHVKCTYKVCQFRSQGSRCRSPMSQFAIFFLDWRLQVSCSYWSKLKNFKNWNNMNQKITERNFTEFGWINLF